MECENCRVAMRINDVYYLMVEDDYAEPRDMLLSVRRLTCPKCGLECRVESPLTPFERVLSPSARTQSNISQRKEV